MGEARPEPSMEEILSSIKRIIADEGDGVVRARFGNPPTNNPPVHLREVTRNDDVLELHQRIDSPHAVREPARDTGPATPESVRGGMDRGAMNRDGEMRDGDRILSESAADASRDSLDALSRMVVRPQAQGNDTLEGLVRELLRPMLRDWLDNNLPRVVEQMVAREIERITGREK